MRTITLKRVVVTGMGILSPVGNNLSEYWQALLSGKSGAAPITLFDATKFRTKFACEVKNFDPTVFIEKKEVRKMDRYCQFAMAAANEAMEHSKLLSASYNPDRVGVIVGSGIGGFTTQQEEIINFAKGDGTPKFNPYFIPKLISDIAAGQISMRYGLRGPNYAVVSACASSTHSILDAFNHIRIGKADVMVAGGSEAAVTESGIGGFNSLRALSERNDAPITASRPFDKDRDGFVLGEGAGILVLEELEHALKRNATIYAEIIGAAATADAYHLTAPHPEGLGARNVMLGALLDGEIPLEDVDYINVHGTSTPLGDIAELKAIKDLFDKHAYKMNISSTKSMTGHLLGAAGVIESIATICAIMNDIVPPTINHFTDDPEIDSMLNLTFNEPQKRTVNVALNNTFGFGGHNACVAFKKYHS